MKLINKFKKQPLFVFGFLGVFVSAILLFSCNKTFPDAANKLNTNYPPNYSNNITANKRVLYIILDGAQGSEVKLLAPTNISKLASSAIYTWIGISGYNEADTTLPSAWTSMMTGVSSTKSKVITGFDSAALATYPSFVTRLAAIAPNVKVDAYASSSVFSTNLLAGAAVNQLTENNDSLVAKNVENSLKTDSAHIVIGQFHSIATAGDAYGYNHSVPQYANAINIVDGYIGDILNALKSRPNYANEDWLIVVASNENGKINGNAGGDSTSAYDDTRHNSFIIFNNSRFQTDFVGSNGTPSTLGLSAYNDSALLLRGTGATRVNVTLPNTNNIYDIHQGSGATIAFKFKLLNKTITGSAYFMNLVANGAGFYSNPNGWSVWLDGSHVKVFAGDNSTYFTNFSSNTPVNDGQWHTICVTLNWLAGTQTINATMYIDGVYDNSTTGTTAAATVISPGNPITIGNTPNQGSASNYSNYYITDFRYWQTSLPYDAVTQYYCKNTIPTSSPYYNKLVTELRLNDGNNSTVAQDLSLSHHNGTVNDPSNIRTWPHFDEISNVVCPSPDQNFYKATPNGLDIPFQIYQWLGIIPQPVWSLDGQYWNGGYNDVQLPSNQ